MTQAKHTPAPWDTKPSAGGHQHLIWDKNGKTIALVYTDATDANTIIQAVNLQSSLIDLLRRVQAFTGDYIDHAEPWEMCAVAELDADICEILNQVPSAKCQVPRIAFDKGIGKE